MKHPLCYTIPMVLVAACVLGVLSPAVDAALREEDWQFSLSPWAVPDGQGCRIGVEYEKSVDGWDGQSPLITTAYTGPMLTLYRAEGPLWGGATGFYKADYEAAIPAGDHKTWWNICLWSQQRTLPGELVTARLGPEAPTPPTGYVARLYVDYVPASLNWTGPMEFYVDTISETHRFTLPVPTTDNPYDLNNVTRMHLTVYAPPLPEPGALVSLAGLCAAGGLAVLRGRRNRG